MPGRPGPDFALEWLADEILPALFLFTRQQAFNFCHGARTVLFQFMAPEFVRSVWRPTPPASARPLGALPLWPLRTLPLWSLGAALFSFTAGAAKLPLFAARTEPSSSGRSAK